MTFTERRQICTAWNNAVNALAALHVLVKHDEVREFVEQACEGLLDRRGVVLTGTGNPLHSGVPD
ncbi:hypothetical protein GXB81_26735 [Paraburkholderia sp. Ac-20336]|uniref:hypothetical protein n=1 Tax=unclassified Paraburkholderia TaxID=2615204 RepID=UPI001421DCB7|nr:MULTISPECIES: hypothetical protein [unclassified Paraburkholderia]MBN3806618.1 hypothetical protein [Paraburkholderia sp. Ac-20336]NIF80285.1 hypothetical protein [Paraburkholderia sp. Cy-641]